MMLLGLVWAVAAPLLLWLPAAALVWGMRRAGRPVMRRHPWKLALAAVGAAVLAVWLPQRWQFHRLCSALGPPQVLQTARADGFFLDDGTANSFGQRYLRDEGFQWMEARSIFKRDGFTRYTRGTDGQITSTETDRLTAEHMAATVHENLPGGVSVQRLQVVQRDNGTVMASAASARFDGGTARWVLGAWGTASCPDPVLPAGSRAFQQTYHLVRDTLHAPAAPAR